MLSLVDYEKVDMRLLSLVSMLNSMESNIIQFQDLPQTGEMIAQIDRYRNEVALEIERQGKRS
jgi:hypothetical protein